jgi:hypothetical protein
MRWVVSGNLLFVLTVAGKPGTKLPATADRFLESLQIGDAKPAQHAPAQVEAPKAPAPARPKADKPSASDFPSGEADPAPAADEPKEKDDKGAAAKSSAPQRFTISRIPRTAKPYPLERLDDLERSYVEQERDGFRDVGPQGSFLVGVRVSFIEKFGGKKLSSAQPIFRSGKTHYLGQVHGVVSSQVTQVVAKPGYAIGGLVTNTGLTVDGFGIVFMKVDGDLLDPTDTYKSPWLGDRQGGSPRDVSTKGNLIVGLQGRARKELNAVGLTGLR